MSEPMSEPRVVVLVRPGCHLCEEAEQVIAAVCGELGIDWSARDINADAELLARHSDEVPVTFVDGRQHDYWRVDPVRLRAALTKA